MNMKTVRLTYPAWVVLGLLILFALVVYIFFGSGQKIPFVSLAQGITLREYDFQTKRPALWIVTSQQDVEQLIPDLGKHVQPDIAPAVQTLQQLDYNQFFAIIVLQGQSGVDKPITIHRVIRTGDLVKIHAEFIVPQGIGSLGVITDPYHIIAISKDDTWKREIIFQLVEDRLFGSVRAETNHTIP
jgi:hypothetical protein